MLVLSLYFPQHARAMAACLPWKDHVWIAIEYFVRFHNNELDGILCKLDSTEYARLFERNPALSIAKFAHSHSKSEKSQWCGMAVVRVENRWCRGVQSLHHEKQ